jgi:D-alanyl-D-alanine dipeptidase
MDENQSCEHKFASKNVTELSWPAIVLTCRFVFTICQAQRSQRRAAAAGYHEKVKSQQLNQGSAGMTERCSRGANLDVVIWSEDGRLAGRGRPQGCGANRAKHGYNAAECDG